MHPKLDVRMMVATAGRSVEEIRAGHVDAGLLTLPVEEADLVTLPVLREELLLVTMPGHPLAKTKKITAQDLAGEPFVLFEAGSGTRRVIDRFFLSENIEPNVVMETENVEIIKAMVKTGLGIGIVPYMAVAREVRARQFFMTRIEGHELFRETGWVYPRANRTPRMIDELLAAFEKVRERIPLSAPAYGSDSSPAPSSTPSSCGTQRVCDNRSRCAPTLCCDSCHGRGRRRLVSSAATPSTPKPTTSIVGAWTLNKD